MNKGVLRGVNIAGWLTLENWVTPDIFAATGALKEEDLLQALGLQRYLDLVEKHRSSFITKTDFTLMAMRGFNAVRIQVPWHIFGENGPLPKTGFRSGIEYLDKAFDWAEATNIDIIIDLCLLPGAKLTEDGLAMICEMTQIQQDTTLDVIEKLAKRYKSRHAFMGFQPVGEIRPQRRRGFRLEPGVPLSRLRTFYRDAYHVIRKTAGEDVVIILNDAHCPSKWRWFMAQNTYENVWLDLHLYHFNDMCDAAGPAGIRKLIADSRRHISQAHSSGLPLMIGEWSAALPIADTSMTPEGRIALERMFVAGQLAAFDNCEAWFFQTWKTQSRVSSWDARIALSSFERDVLL